MKSFNFKYLKQNLKKSRITLAFVLLILPIMNLIIFLMSTSGYRVNILDLDGISILTILGMYILPVILSIILFSFVFKKKSIDFMGSMPIDRKTIFVTNTIGGIGIILLLLVVTTILMVGASMVLPNVYVPMGVFLDYLVLFIISYIFVFTSCNLAMSVSGNVATTIVVTALILFFIPFHHFIFNELIFNNSSTYHALEYKCEECDINEYINWMCGEDDPKCAATILHDKTYTINVNEINNLPSYTMPSNIVLSRISGTRNNAVIYENSMIGKMVLISILYILIGCSLFEKREMEICEISFKKFRTHQVVKVLTLIPIFIVMSLALEYAGLLAWVFCFFLILVYNFVYDLITRHTIEKIPRNIVTYSITFILVSVICVTLQATGGIEKEPIVFTFNDVEDMTILIDSFNSYGNGEYIEVTSSNLRKEILNGMYSQDKEGYYVSVELEINDKLYMGEATISKETFNRIQKNIATSDVYQNISLKERIKDAAIITVYNDYMKLSQEGYKVLENLKTEEDVITDYDLYASLYTYKNHELKELRIPSGISKEFRDILMYQLNEKSKELKLDDIYHVEVKNIVSDEYFYTKNVNYESIFLAKVLGEKTINWEKDVYKISMYTNNGIYYYYANLKDEVLGYLIKED